MRDVARTHAAQRSERTQAVRGHLALDPRVGNDQLAHPTFGAALESGSRRRRICCSQMSDSPTK